MPAKKFSPKSKTDPKRIILELNQDVERLERLLKETQEIGVKVDDKISMDFDATDFMKLF